MLLSDLKKVRPIYNGETLTTLDRDQMNRYRQIDWAQYISFSETTCDQMRLDTLMEKLEVPKGFDVLVVDVEGKEPEVFQTFKMDEWKPKMLIVGLKMNIIHSKNSKIILKRLKNSENISRVKDM